METINLAVLGCGQNGARLVAALASRTDCLNIRVHVGARDALEQTRCRIANHTRDTRTDRLPRLILTDDKVVATQTDIVLEQLPSNGLKSFGAPDAHTTRGTLRELYCRGLSAEAIVLQYSAHFPSVVVPKVEDGQEETTPVIQERVGYFHYSNPADCLPLIEVGMNGYSPVQLRIIQQVFQHASFFPVVKESWLTGFLSIRFQVALLKAAMEVIGKRRQGIPQLAARIDSAISKIVQLLQRIVPRHPDGRGVFEELSRLCKSGLEVEKEFRPLWNAFASVWKELKETWSEKEVAWGLLCGPALRCINPGFLRTVDIEGVSAFFALVDKQCDNYNVGLVEHLLRQGRRGGMPSHSEVYQGFYDWDTGEHEQVVRTRDAFLEQNRVTPPVENNLDCL